MDAGPVASTRISVARRSSGQGTGGEGAVRPSRLSASREMGRFFSAATAARRSESEGSPLTSAVAVRTTSSSATPMPGSFGSGVRGMVAAWLPRPRPRLARARDHAPRRRQASSPSQATVRPAVATSNISESASGSPSALATSSCSWRSNLFRSRPARRCSSTRIVVRTARASSMAIVST